MADKQPYLAAELGTYSTTGPVVTLGGVAVRMGVYPSRTFAQAAADANTNFDDGDTCAVTVFAGEDSWALYTGAAWNDLASDTLDLTGSTLEASEGTLDDGAAVYVFASATVSGDHGAQAGLADDDHEHYHTDARGDARYLRYPLVNDVDLADSALGSSTRSFVEFDSDLRVNGELQVQNGFINSEAYDDPGVAAFTLDTENTFALGDLFEVQNNGVTQLSIDANGNLAVGGTSSASLGFVKNCTIQLDRDNAQGGEEFFVKNGAGSNYLRATSAGVYFGSIAFFGLGLIKMGSNDQITYDDASNEYAFICDNNSDLGRVKVPSLRATGTSNSYFEHNLAVGHTSPDTKLDVNGALTLRELSADPAEPDEGATAIWMSDGTGSGDDGDILMKITAGGSTKTVTLVDFSAA